jgi:phosphatidylcholine synthase
MLAEFRHIAKCAMASITLPARGDSPTMTSLQEPPPKPAWARAAGFGVHVLTASGGALALLALIAAVEGRFADMFAWLGVALVVDAIDGPLARYFDVTQEWPRWSGDTLDLVVDILTYVFVPAYALAASDLLPRAAALPLALVVVVTSVLYFADRRMKSLEHHFVGFPAVWNALVFYLFLLQPPPLVTAGIVVALAIATFLRIPFVHPFRVAFLRPLSVAMVVIWAVLAVIAVIRDLSPGPLILTGLSVIAIYFLAAGLVPRPK